MFQGRMSLLAFSVTDGSSRMRSTSGENRSEQHRRGEAAAARVAGEEERRRVEAVGEQRPDDVERVVATGGVRELRSQAVVGHEDVARRLVGEPPREGGVHGG